MTELQLCQYLARIDGKTLYQWRQATKKGLRAVDKLRIFYVSLHEAKQETEQQKVKREGRF